MTKMGGIAAQADAGRGFSRSAPGKPPATGGGRVSVRSALRHPLTITIASLTGFVLLWWLLAAWNDRPVQLPTPRAVLSALLDLADDGELLDNVELSFGRLLISMVVAIAAAVPLGFAMGLSESTRAYVDPFVEMLRPISGIAWIPLGLFIFGVGDMLPVFIMAYVAFFPLLLSTMAGVRGVDRRLVAAARTMGVPSWRIVARVVVPASIPTIMIGMRLAFAGAWTAIVAAELIGAPSGLGFAIGWYRELLASPKVFAYIVAVAVVGRTIDLTLQYLQRRMTPWSVR